MDNDKYVVFKRSDWHRLMGTFTAMTNPSAIQIRDQFENQFLSKVLSDAIVIRPQDVFAGPALHAYAASIDIVLFLAEKELGFEPGDDELAHLQDLRDFFFMKAVEADNYASEEKKIPD